MTDSIKETDILRRVQRAISHGATRLFRNSVGAAQLKDGSWVRYGLGKGTADLIGWHSITVMPWHVGKRIAVFSSLEVKTSRGRPTPDQITFLKQVRSAGGIAGIVTNEQEALLLLSISDAGSGAGADIYGYTNHSRQATESEADRAGPLGRMLSRTRRPRAKPEPEGTG